MRDSQGRRRGWYSFRYCLRHASNTAVSVYKMGCNPQLREVVPNNPQGLNVMAIRLAISLGKNSKHRSFVQNCEY
jgi:hypothetical protein